MTALPPLFGAMNSAAAQIAAPPESIWLLMFQRELWIADFIGKELLDGPENTVGERARFSTRIEDGAVAARLEEILLLDAPHRLVTCLIDEASGCTYAFAEWRLAPEGAATRLEMNLYWTDLPEEGADRTAIVSQRRGYMAHTQAALDGHIARIAEAIASR